MRRVLRITGKLAAGIVALLVVILAASALGYSREMAIDRSRGIDESGYVRIGGIEQWIQIRGDDRSNPVLLWLNGGPGFSTISATPLFRSWEKYFTVVMWDQRGEGRTFERNGPHGSEPMTIDRMVDDGIELSQYLRTHLHKQKIVIFGHSWGSILGVRMVKERPDMFAAYVGTGQVTNMQADIAAAYPSLRARAETLKNSVAINQLAGLGAPPYMSPQKSLDVIIWANALDVGEVRLPHTIGFPWVLIKGVLAGRVERPGARYSQEVMLEPLLQADLLPLGTRFDVPVVIIQGSEDLVAVTALAKDYFDSISAPHKEFVVLRGDGHLALFTDRDTFLAALVAHVRPLLASSRVSGSA